MRYQQLTSQKLPDEIQDAYMKHFGEPATAEVLTHLKRDLIHAIYMLLLDDEFIEAYKNGILIRCSDRITRRVFPRFFVYSADYPEKCVCLFTETL